MEYDTLFNITVTDVCAANRLVKSQIGVTVTRKNRERWGILLKTKGKTIYTCQGKEIICDSTHPVILSKGSCYTYRCIEAGECIAFEFDSAQISDNIYSFDYNNSHFIINSFTKFEKALTLKYNGYRIESMNIIYSLLLGFCKSANREYSPSAKQKLLSPAISYIAEHYYNSKITNDYLAELCSVSTVYFRKTFKSVYGISAGEYLQNLRINKAISLLKGDFESISQVAISVGYSSIYHFSKMFKQVTGLTPSEYSKLK